MNNMTTGHAYTVRSSENNNPKTAENILESDLSKFIKFYRRMTVLVKIEQQLQHDELHRFLYPPRK